MIGTAHKPAHVDNLGLDGFFDADVPVPIRRACARCGVVNHYWEGDRNPSCGECRRPLPFVPRRNPTAQPGRDETR